MTYSLEVAERLDKVFSKLAKKDKKRLKAIHKKIYEILQDPHRHKPLKGQLKNKRRVHIDKSFVLIYKIDEKERTVKVLEFDHHDKAYK